MCGVLYWFCGATAVAQVPHDDNNKRKTRVSTWSGLGRRPSLCVHVCIILSTHRNCDMITIGPYSNNIIKKPPESTGRQQAPDHQDPKKVLWTSGVRDVKRARVMIHFLLFFSYWNVNYCVKGRIIIIVTTCYTTSPPFFT